MLRILAPCVLLLAVPALGVAGVPVIYSTDLYHPHDDPDDHYDLATLFALPELEVKGIIIDMSNKGEIRANQRIGKKPGVVAVDQMAHLTGRAVPVALGLEEPLRSMGDTALEQPQTCQGAVELILTTLRESPERVSIFTVGSLRDVAAAFNREPDLMHSKVKAIYINAGTGPDRFQEEWNVHLDVVAYRRILLSDLPLRWYPCFGRDGYRTYFRVDQSEILSGVTAPLRAFFDYALSHSQEEPIQFLSRDCPAPVGPRNMWCTASFIDLAGRQIYRTNNGYEALADPPNTDAHPVKCYQMRPVRLAESTKPPTPRVPAGTIAATFVGGDQDLVGKSSFEPDGTPDCRVHVCGLPVGKQVASAKLVGTRNGKWLSDETPERWLLKTRWIGDQLRVTFSFWAPGAHQLTLNFEDGTSEQISFHIPVPGSPWFVADLAVSESNVQVILVDAQDYTKVMSSCLKNMLIAL